MKKGMGIRAKLLVGIVPFVVIALVILTILSAYMSRDIITKQIRESMSLQLEANTRDIANQLDQLRLTTQGISTALGNVFGKVDDQVVRTLIIELMEENDLVNAAAIWLEPYIRGPEMPYSAPYFYKDAEDNIHEIDIGTDGQYMNEDFYQFAKAQSEMNSMITDPVYSEQEGTLVVRCAAPLYLGGRFAGCVTTVVPLELFDSIVAKMDFGEHSDKAIITADGRYIYNANSELVQSGTNMTDRGDGLGAATTQILGKPSGRVSYQGSDDTYYLYFSQIGETGWQFVVRLRDSVLFAEVEQLVIMLAIICVIAVVVCIIIIFIQAGSMAKAVRTVEIFADELARGDFTVDKISTKRRDELGVMSSALNTMFDSNKDMIGRISYNSTNVHDSSERLQVVAKELHARFSDIKENMAKVNDAMMSSSAATEEVSASVNEVNASVQKLSEETTRTDDHVKEISSRASDIMSHSSNAFENAKAIYNQRSEELNAASKKAEVVNEIGNLASAIADIADQINLLSLNASIEAARAGEHGKGFAVVASEINKLASETQEAVTQIQTTIDAVQDAFGDLSRSSNDLLVFINDTVTPDYESFVDVGQQYGRDAASFAELTADIMEMIGFIHESMEQVNAAVNNIAESTQETASSSSEITEVVTEVNDMVNDVGTMVSEQTEVAKDLHGIVTRFKLQ